MKNQKTSFIQGLSIIFYDRWRLLIFIFMGLWYLSAWRDLIRDDYFPLKNNLMIGEKIAGPLSKFVDPSIPILSPYGYDSQYFWALSLDPTLHDTLILNTLGAKAYRSQRIVLPYLTHMIIRNPSNILYGLWFWACIGGLLGIIGMYRICTYFNVTPVIPILGYVFSPGLFITTIHPMSDGLATGLLLLGISYWFHRRYAISAVLFSVACLTREASVFIGFLLGFYCIFINRKNKYARVLPLVLSSIPLILWQLYLHRLFGAWATVKAVNYDFPFVGSIKSFTSYFDHRISKEDLFTSVLIHATCLLVLIRWARHWRDELFFLVLTFAIFILICGKAVMEDNYSSCRISLLYSVLLMIALVIPINKTNISNA